MDRLTADDRLMLLGDGAWPQDIGALATLDGSSLLDTGGSLQIEAVKEAIEGRLHLLPRFRQLLCEPRPGLGGPLWVDAPTFDLNDHVRVAPVPPPGDETRLLAAIEQLRRRRLDRSRPLWEMWFLTGLPHARIGLFIRIHHVIADGVAGVATLGTLLDATPAATGAPAPRWIPAPAPSTPDLLVDNVRRRADSAGRAVSLLAHPAVTVRHVKAAWPMMRWILADAPGPATSLDHMVGPDRRFSLIRSGLDQIVQIAHAHEAKVNDVLLASIAGGLRGLLHHRGEHVDDLVLPIYVPVSLRRQRPAQDAGNLVSQMVVPLSIGVSEPGRRLRQIAEETVRRKARGHASLGAVLPSNIAGRAMVKLVVRRRVNLTSADLPGPEAPRYLAGARLIEVFPMLPLIGNVSLGIGALSYAGQFNMMAVADADAHPDIDVFAAAVRHELGALAASTSAGTGRRR